MASVALDGTRFGTADGLLVGGPHVFVITPSFARP